MQKLLSLQELLPLKSVEAGEAAAKDQGVDFVCALIGVDRLQVQHVADDREFERNAAGAMDGTRHTGDFERLGYAIFLGHAHLVGGQAVLVFEAGEVVIHELALGNLQGHVDELFLDELLAGNRHAELHALAAVVERRVEARLGGA